MQGLVMRSTGSWYEVRTDDQQIFQCRLKGKFKIKGIKETNPIAVGDQVLFELEEAAGSQGIIYEILPRENYIVRKSVHKTGHSHIIAANLDQAILIVTLFSPRTSLGFIDRFLVTAETFRIPSVLIFNKSDMWTEEGWDYAQELKDIYAPLGYTCLMTSATEKTGIDAFEAQLEGKKSLLSGHSGVGKSSLVNGIAPGLELKTSEVSSFADKGVHTTTFAEMYELKEGTFIIDTPGIKELGLVNIDQEELSHYFPEMRARFGTCKFYNCLHLNEPKCAIRDAAESGEIAPSRYLSYLSMMEDYDNRR